MSFKLTPSQMFTTGTRGHRVHFRGRSKSHGWRGQVGTVFYRSRGNQIIHTLSGITKDSAGAVLAGCTVDMFRTLDDVLVDRATSDGAGVYTIPVSGPGGPFYLVAYKAGAPDVAGTSVNTLIAI